MLYNNRNMNRPQRTIKAPTRLIQEETPQPKKAKATPKRTLNLDVPKVVVKDNFVEDVINRPKTTTRKTKAGVKTTLHLDLSDVPPSDDRKFSKDWAMDDIWFKNFYTPNDNTTKLYAEAVMNIEFLPANFVYDPQYKENYGFANLELKEELKRPMKKIPLFSKLERGDYHTAASNSDDNIAGSIKFFRNNLPSFKKYKNQDDISWVVNQHRQLTAEIFDYYSKKASQRVATLKGRFNAITRIFRIAFETKNYDLYDKYSSLVIFLNQYYESDDNQNELSDIEKKKFITFDVVLDKQKQLQNQFEAIENKQTTRAYDLNQDLLLVSLYSLIPPLRNEVKSLKFTTTVKNKEDWVYFRQGEVFLDLNEVKKRHYEIWFNLSVDAPELAKILEQSYELYPRQSVFTHLKKYPDVSNQATPQSLDDRITKLFAFTGKMVSVNTFRSSYVSYMNREALKKGRLLTMNQKEKIAERMRTSVKYLDSAYLKIFPIEKEELAFKEDPERRPLEAAVDEGEQVGAYSRQLMRNKRYYDNNKEKVLKKQKEYKDAKPLYDKSRVRMLHFLNNEPDYYSRMKDATKDKYNFKFVGGKWT